MLKGLLDEIISHGDRGAIVPFSRVDGLKQDMIELKNGGYHTTWLDRMTNYITVVTSKMIPSNLGFEPRSLILVVMPSPKVMLQFNYYGKPVHCTVPPIYTDEHINENRVLRYISDYLAPLGFSAPKTIMLPQKLLAVHCGLSRYGRNNICYNDEFGSYMQMTSYVSDLPCDQTTWFPIRRMEACDNCHACVTACPTGAIDSGRQLINSDRCITFFNELPGEFPEWLDKDAHNSIVGCMKCQNCCPANAHNKNNIAMGVTFTEEETTEFLNHKIDEPYTGSLAAKIEATGILPEITHILPRNLALLL